MLRKLAIVFFPLLHFIGYSQTPFTPVESINSVLTDAADGKVAWVDYNLDQLTDIFICGEHMDVPVIRLYTNVGNDLFEEVSWDVSPLIDVHADWGDYNNDGYPDLIYCGRSPVDSLPQTYVVNNNAGISFELSTLNLPAVFMGSCMWVELNNDDYPDLCIMGASEQDSTGKILSATYILENNNGTSFDIVNEVMQGVYNCVQDWADYDLDNDPDLIMCGQYDLGSGFSLPYTKLYRNDGSGVFKPMDFTFPDVMYADAQWGDYNNDMYPDLLLNGDPETPTYLTWLFKNLGNGEFTDVGIEIFGTIHGNTSWVDYDVDGDLDFLHTGYLNHPNPQLVSRMYRNFGNDMFTVDGNIDLPEVYYSCLSWTDYDNDGDPDLLLSGYQEIPEGNAVTSVFANNRFYLSYQVNESLSGITYQLQNGELYITCGSELKASHIYVYDLAGNCLVDRKLNNIEDIQIQLPANYPQTGIIQLKTQDGVITRKISFISYDR